MKNLIILISILLCFNVNAQLLGPEEYFEYVDFIPAIGYVENDTLNEINSPKFRATLLIITIGFLDKKGMDRKKYKTDLVVHPINFKQVNFDKKRSNELEPASTVNFWITTPDFLKKVADRFELLNIELNDTISFDDLNVKYAEAKWLQAMDETKKAEHIFSFIESLAFQDKRLRFIHASRLRLAQIKFKKGLKNEALDLLYKVNNKELLDYSPDLYYDSGFNYNKEEPAKRLINYIKETEKR